MPTVLLPWQGGCPHREAALAWVIDRYTRLGWPVEVAERPPDGPWCKAEAVMPAVEAAPDGIVVVADADVWGEGLEGAVAAVEDGAAWATPHRMLFRMGREATEQVLAGTEPGKATPKDGRFYDAYEGGGVVVARRETLLQVPLDPRFIGWGQEDECWAMALRALAGVPRRGQDPLFHLWHPPQERLSRRYGSLESKALRRRYIHARGEGPEQMRKLIEEAKRAATPHP